MDKKRHKKIKVQERTKKTKFSSFEQIAERMRPFVPINRKDYDAEINYFRQTYGSDTPFFYQAIFILFAVRLAQRNPINELRTLLSPHKVRPINKRNYIKSKRRKMVQRPVSKKKINNKDKSPVLRKSKRRIEPIIKDGFREEDFY